jgi:hypothetical protein
LTRQLHGIIRRPVAVTIPEVCRPEHARVSLSVEVSTQIDSGLLRGPQCLGGLYD